MELKIYQVDAFTDKVFSGNPAAVCPLENWLTDDMMQNIAAENNLAETAFYVKQDTKYEIRWFTPAVEVDLCGHATLATAFVLFHHENHSGNNIEFYSLRSGSLTVTKSEDLLTLNFPTDSFEEVMITDAMKAGLNATPKAAFKGKSDLLVVFENEDEILDLKPAFDRLAQLNARGIIVTAKGNEVDFVSRFFAPQVGINEDPVTGSAHTTLIPYWSKQLNKKVMTAIQLSARKGHLQCAYLNDRVAISGKGKLYLKGAIFTD